MLRRALIPAIALTLVACGPSSGGPDAGPSAAAPAAPPEDAGPADAALDVSGAEGGAEDAGSDAAPASEARACPPDMVRVAKRYCVDRYEAILVDAKSGQQLSPYYPPTRKMAAFVEKLWTQQRLETGDEDARKMPIPILPAWEKTRELEPRAVSRRGVTPQGYTSGEVAAIACRNAGKRLCTLDEWRTACRGERDQPFPYGEEYSQGGCNIFREGHPAAVLHGNASVGHTDPRLNQVRVNGKPLLRRTGDTPRCMSPWEDDAIADMNGNIDEWIDDPEGTFVGGFFSRSKKDGCASTITGHNFDYFDYSTGVRCCKDL